MGVFGGTQRMSADTAKPADGRFLHSILVALIVAALASGAVAAFSIAKSEEPGQATVVTQP
jgi:hypothetical protein